MANVKDTMVQYPSDGVTVHAYVAAPSKTVKCPALIVVQEWWGLNDHIKDIARRFAAEGYVVVAPDLYSRMGRVQTTDSKEAGQYMSRLKQDEVLSDLNATVTYIQKAPEVDADRVGVIGFCMGGGYALTLPCVNEGVKAAVPFYGPIPNPDTPIQSLGCPILYVYGEDDGWITKADVQRLVGALKKYNKPGEVKTYPGAPHAFFNDTRKEVYKPAEAKDAWERALAFFKQHLQ
ncbi:MAG: dienelactone hydrolase family protein [Nitrospiraceae bacterium]